MESCGIRDSRGREERKGTWEASSGISHLVVSRFFSYTMHYSVIHLRKEPINFFLKGQMVNISLLMSYHCSTLSS